MTERLFSKFHNICAVDEVTHQHMCQLFQSTMTILCTHTLFYKECTLGITFYQYYYSYYTGMSVDFKLLSTSLIRGSLTASMYIVIM